MPELPEVERARRLLEERCLGRQVTSIKVADDTIVFCNTASVLFDALVGRRVKQVSRRGKLFFLEFDQPPALVCHFGMTGNIQFANENPLEYRRSGKNVMAQTDWPPKYWKLIMELSSDQKIARKKTGTSSTGSSSSICWAFTDPRRLGPPISELGFDPILSMPNQQEFMEAVRKRRTPIKALLLDQHFSAGVGNWVADEVLYQSRIYPGRAANTLTDSELHRLHKQLHEVCREACAVNADSKQFPETWLFHRRWGKGKGASITSNGPVTTEGHSITFETHGGRTSAVVLALQLPLVEHT
ncbi:Formamidopyrimidine-DNA glycosylase N-terminal domain-containing protein [Syncephalis plumigaleata]|nr:Formamidopyrimidine-DNA glycosylase N-terminal domain-containing protein [Syncephalis plumigaleata]